MEYEDFELQIGPQLEAGLLVRVRSPAGEGETKVQLPRYAGDLELLAGVAQNFTCEASGLPSSPEAVGGDLFRSVFIGPVSDLFQQSLSRVEASARGLRLRIRIRINLRDRTLAPLLDYPGNFCTGRTRKSSWRSAAGRRSSAPWMCRDPPRFELSASFADPGCARARSEKLSPQSGGRAEAASGIPGGRSRDPARDSRRSGHPDTPECLGPEGHPYPPLHGARSLRAAERRRGTPLRGPEGRMPVTGRHLVTKEGS